MPFDSVDDIRAFCRDLPKGDARAAEAAARRQHTAGFMLWNPEGLYTREALTD